MNCTYKLDMSVELSCMYFCHSRSDETSKDLLSTCWTYLQENFLWVVGLIEEDVDRTTTLLKNFFKHSESTTLSYPCNPDVAEHVAKFSASDDQFPSSVNVDIASFGVQLCGPIHETEKGVPAFLS